MKLYTKCKHCKNELKCSSLAGTRVEFAMQKWEKKDLKCNSCETKNEYHVDELYAKPSRIAEILAGLIFIVGTPLVFLFLSPIVLRGGAFAVFIISGLFLVPVIVFGIIKKQDQIRVKAFNRSKLKGRIHNI